MKSKKTMILLAVLFVIVLSVAGYATYARYVASGSGAAAVDVAKWNINIDGTAVTSSAPVTITKTLTWTGLSGNVVEGKIAPGMSTNAGIYIDPTDTEVAIDFYVKVAPNNVLVNPNIHVGTIAAGMCSDGTSTDETSCGAGNWTPVTLTLENSGKYSGYYKGSVTLPEGAKMRSSEKVNIGLPIVWEDLYEDADENVASTGNAQDTSTGIADPAGAAVDFTVVVEQKVA